MKTISELLRGADPLSHEPMWSAQERLAVEQKLLATVQRDLGSLRRRRLIVAGAVAAVIAAVAVAPKFVVQAAAVRFEVRLCEEAPGPGLEPETVLPSNQRQIYLHRDPIVTNGDIATARVVPVSNSFVVEVTFTSSAAERMFRATRQHIGKPVAILIDGEIVAAPVLRSPIRNTAQITGDFTRAEAERIAEGMIGQ